jgi:hypothetical protein
VVDKLKLKKIVEQNLEDFQAVLHSLAMQPDDCIDNKKLDEFLMLCCNQEDLIGMLLGFGKQNAQLFCKYKGTPLDERPLISAWPEEESINLEKLIQKDLTFDPWDISDLFYPRFVCDPQSEETKQLKQTYRAEREKIIQYFEGKDIVEATLSLFNQSL